MAQNLHALVRQLALRRHLNPNVEERQIGAESGFNPNAVSSAGAVGLGQLMPGTARSLGVKNSRDPYQNLTGSMKYMRQLLDQFHGNYKLALAAYNAGPGNVKAGMGYADKILAGKTPPASQSVSGPPVPTSPLNTRAQLALALIGFGNLGGMDPLTSALMKADAKPQFSHRGDGTASVAPDNTNVKGLATFEGKKVAAWIKPWLDYGRAHGWTGSVSSGFRSDAQQTRIYESGVRPAAVPKSLGGPGSNHEGSQFPLGAVDVTQAQQLARILHGAHSPLEYAGAKDPVHFSHPHGGGY